MHRQNQNIDHLTYSLDRLLFLLITIAVIRIAGLFLVDLPLFGDEAQYWSWAKELDFGYYSKPPMLSWSIALTTGIFGDAEWALRLPTLIFHSFTSVAVYLLARRLYDPRIAFFAALVFATLPSVWLSSLVASTDPPLLCFWAFALLNLHRAVDQDDWISWTLFGICTGLGMLSKFATLYLLIGFVLWCALDKEIRAKVALPKLAVALVLAFLVFLPNLLWNAAHDFVSWTHLGENANLGGDLFQPGKALEFQASQLGVFGPVLYPVLIWLVLTAKRRWQDPSYRFLFCFVAPAMAIIAFQGLLSRANANWQATAFVAASILVTAELLRAGRPGLVRGSAYFHSALGIAIIVLGTLSAASQWPLPVKDPFARLKGWDVMGQQVTAFADQYPERPLLFSHRMTLAEMLYYAPDVQQPLLKWNPDPWVNDHYELTTTLLDKKGQDMILVSRDPNPQRVFDRFSHAEKLGEIEIQTGPNRKLWYGVWTVDNFKGYAFEETESGTQ